MLTLSIAALTPPCRNINFSIKCQNGARPITTKRWVTICQQRSLHHFHIMQASKQPSNVSTERPLVKVDNYARTYINKGLNTTICIFLFYILKLHSLMQHFNSAILLTATQRLFFFVLFSKSAHQQQLPTLIMVAAYFFFLLVPVPFSVV